MSEIEYDEVQLQAEYDACTDPAKGTFEQFKAVFLENQLNRAKIAIVQKRRGR